MLATKTRINVSIPRATRRSIELLARRDEMPEATKAAELIRHALECEEDEVWDAAAAKRDRKGARFVSHQKAWA